MSIGSSELLVEADAAIEIVVAPGEVTARSPLQLFWRRFKKDRIALISLGVIGGLMLIAIFAPVIDSLVGAPGPNVQNTQDLNQTFGTATGPSHNALWPFIVFFGGIGVAILISALPESPIRRYGPRAVVLAGLITAIVLAIVFWPSAKHIFGIDENGRDIFARTLYGARVSLLVAFVATGISMVVGVTAGLVAGFYGGVVDMAISRVIDLLLAFPILLLALGLASACSLGGGCFGGALQPGIVVVIFVIAFVNWTYIARIVRGQVLSLREKEFVDAARSLGASNTRIIVKEILPNLVAPIIVYATLIIPQNILFEAALSYLGAGVQPPTASWGQMISNATSIFPGGWWYMLFPGAALLLTVLAFNLVGDGLQDALHPRSGDA
ncbi:MAG: ABC transporter permease [Solirubrobacteraceae bacterium]